MAKAYSMDLRERVIRLVEEGKKIVEISKLYGISRKVIFDWKKRKKETGNIRPIKRYQKGHSHKIRDLESFKKFVDDNNDKSLNELSRLWPTKISASTISRMIKRLGYSYKKDICSSETR